MTIRTEAEANSVFLQWAEVRSRLDTMNSDRAALEGRLGDLLAAARMGDADAKAEAAKLQADRKRDEDEAKFLRLTEASLDDALGRWNAGADDRARAAGVAELERIEAEARALEATFLKLHAEARQVDVQLAGLRRDWKRTNRELATLGGTPIDIAPPQLPRLPSKPNPRLISAVGGERVLRFRPITYEHEPMVKPLGRTGV